MLVTALTTDTGHRLSSFVSPFSLRKLEQFSIECHKAKTKGITLTNHKEHRQSRKPIKIRSKYVYNVQLSRSYWVLFTSDWLREWCESQVLSSSISSRRGRDRLWERNENLIFFNIFLFSFLFVTVFYRSKFRRQQGLHVWSTGNQVLIRFGVKG